ncbi:efflux RND transporter permease subunit [Haloplasma contractile]|uniref:2-C-methyl-D-erythritol 4-phosphate cytidylyltransferase protein n=1 Tax=Haloplasma contractile SSD-17B TaxID=1033810 RepID=F7PSI4_9MOLU|nr:efflux RND transporter permease subunit [Haloplasma contractile]ERJ12628.1 2-C-methyl-D-erythritol 4-phosphate cytidylyltransferase protein [Haloplasma contractile SSD-17B]
MGNFSEYSVKRPITILMAVLIVIILGTVSLTKLKKDLFPSINFPVAVVSTTYMGASPEEVEMSVTKPLENSLATVSNIKSIESISQEHSSLIILKFNQSTNMDSAMIEIRENLDMVTSYLPDEIGNPMIMKMNPEMFPIMNFSFALHSKDINETTILMQDKILPRLERIPGVATITLSGAAENKVHIVLEDEAIHDLRNTYGIEVSKEMISGILKGQNFSMPGGYLNDEGTDYLVRVGDQLKDIEEIKNLPILVMPQKTITIDDIADVKMVNEADQSYSKVNGEDAITLTIQKQNNYETTEVVESINRELDKIRKDYEGVEVVVLLDQAKYINQSISSVTHNILIGGALAILILLLFLRDLKPTFVIALAIPISVMAAFSMIYFAGITLNVISMGGLALGIGMLVDNSIVVIENIYRLRVEGKPAREAAVIGARQVGGAITASTLTTVSVFLPIVFIEGLTAEIFKEMALTISFSLLASLIIAVTLVPTLSAKMLNKNQQATREHNSLDFVKRIYTSILKFSLKHKVIILITSILVFGLSIYLSMRVGTEFIPTTDEGQITVNVEMPKGTEFEETAATLDDLVNELIKLEDIDTVGAKMGGGFLNFNIGGSKDSGTINIILKEDRKQTTNQISSIIRNLTENYKADITVEASNSSMGMMGESGISISVKGHDLEKLEEIATDLETLLKNTEGTTEIDNGVSKTSPELKITVNKESSIAKNLTIAQVYMRISEMLKTDDTVSAISINGRDYNITVKDAVNTKNNVDIEAIENLPFKYTNPVTQIEETILLKEIATIEIADGFGTINRIDQSRTISVSSQIEEGYNIGKVGQKVQKQLDTYDLPSGYTLELQGEQQQINSALIDLSLALILAVVLVYMVMAAQFQSLVFPFIVMFTIPLAFTGGSLGLFITGTPISVVSAIGFIILAGIVVNNGIVLIDYINQLKEDGMSTYDAIFEAGNTRLRPIVMTALTTILALSTMAIGFGEGSESLQPMAITAIGGLVYSTLLTLIIVPVIYAGLDRFRKTNR